MLVIVDHHAKLLAGDRALLDTDTERLLDPSRNGPAEQEFVADSPARSKPVDRPMYILESIVNLGTKLIEPPVRAVEALIHAVEALIYAREAALHLGTQRAQLGDDQGDFFTAREGLQKRVEQCRLQVRPPFQQVRQTTAEQFDQVLVAEW
ncbi:MAG: hypothetical protein OXP69_24615 [Spirochaetaceae bacterium]|nr:hypothetical protein [Spirochaetaceae bacterium]